ncbi:MAG: glycerol kinase GlpK [Propionibacteriaceae bacterium]|jgi:glycerol kinase|nr:glycerol kinase GlpK [Propionibacteriaceae bacterium]
MSEKKYIMALDSGTTGVRTIIWNEHGQMIGDQAKEFTQIYPKPGWVEHNAEEILESQLWTARKAIEKAGITPADIRAIGITNQRESAVLWDKATGKPLYNSICWQSRQTADIIEGWAAQGLTEEIKDKTGLVIDAYFSASKIPFVFDVVPGSRQRAEAGEIAFGTIDTWLLWNLTGGKTHATDYSNASRSMVFNIRTKQWDVELCQKMDIPMALLPDVRDSNGDYGVTDESIFGVAIPIRGVAGDQQSALFGQACFTPGMAKNTFGTAGVYMMNTGDQLLFKEGLTTTIAWGLDGKISYALEGVIFVSGATIQWLRDELKLIHSSADTEWYGFQVPDTGGVYLVPAFVGLCAPYWDMYARGIIVGLTRGSNRNHLIRAGLESLAYQTKDIINAVIADGSIEVSELRVDGGAVANNLLCQFQADLLGVPVIRPTIIEMTALGAAYLAGLGSGLWSSTDDIAGQWGVDRRFEPEMTKERREALYQGWQAAVELSRGWAKKVSV